MTRMVLLFVALAGCSGDGGDDDAPDAGSDPDASPPTDEVRVDELLDEDVSVDDGVSDTIGWPVPSERTTDSRSARAFERATVEDDEPRLDELEIDDGFGI